ncbi:MAG: group 1 glycosyl transferase [Chloroflexi bacterium]|nr:group 1 glycosyl transferase [Chloroflexota bacterium]
MKIALVCPASLPATQFGGILFLSIHIAKYLSNIGHEITIYTTNLDFANNASTFNKKLPTQEKIGNYIIKRTNVWFSTFLFFVNPGMYKQMMNDDFDIIHAIGVRSFQAFIATLVSKRKKIPLIISDQGGLTTHPDLKKSSIVKRILIELQKPIIKFVINNSKKIIVANEYEKKIFLNFCDESKIVIVKNGIDLNELKHSENNFQEKYSIDEKFILFLGRFHTVKGIDTLIESFHQIKNNNLLKNIKLVIMGVDFGYQNVMEQKISEFELSEKLLIIKKPPREDVISAYENCEFLVLPSKWELSPLTPLEGFAFKKTVISTTAHGIPHTIQHNENCILVKPENPSELSDAILNLLNDEKKCQDLGNSGYNLVNSICNSERMVIDTLRVYKQLIKVI